MAKAIKKAATRPIPKAEVVVKNDRMETVRDVMGIIMITLLSFYLGYNFPTKEEEDGNVHTHIDHEGGMRYIIYRYGSNIQVVNYSIDSAKLEQTKPLMLEWRREDDGQFYLRPGK